MLLIHPGTISQRAMIPIDLFLVLALQHVVQVRASLGQRDCA